MDVVLQLCSLHVSTDGSYEGNNGGSASSICTLHSPLANDYSNILEIVKWANEHDEACQEISKKATEFMEHFWMSKQAKRDTKYLQKALVTSYM